MHNYRIGQTVIANGNEDAWRDDVRGISVTRMNRFAGRVLEQTVDADGNCTYTLIGVCARRRSDAGRVFEGVPEKCVSAYEYHDGDRVEVSVGAEQVSATIESVPRWWWDSDAEYTVRLVSEDADRLTGGERLIRRRHDSVRLAPFGSVSLGYEYGVEELEGFHLWDRVCVSREGYKTNGYIMAMRPDSYAPVRVLTDDEVGRPFCSDQSDGVAGRYVVKARISELTKLEEDVPLESKYFKVGERLIAYHRSSNAWCGADSYHEFKGDVTELLPGGLVRAVCTSNRDSHYVGREFVLNGSNYAKLRALGEERDRIVCMNCGEPFDINLIDPDDPTELDSSRENDDYYVIDGEYICSTCVENEYEKCYYCGEWFYKDEMSWSEYLGSYVCESCRDDNLYWCDRCEDYTPNTCEVIVSEDGDTQSWCDDCAGNYATWCDNCETYYSDDFDSCPNCGAVDDDACDSVPARGNRGINNYSFKPHPCFQFIEGEDTDRDNVLFYGVEDETDSDGGGCPNDYARALYDMELPLYCKHDGSLDDGVEVVTHPCTLRYHLESELWDKVCKTGLDHGMRSHDTTTCGLHVHISRKPFITKGIKDYEERLMFAYDHYITQWKKIARRFDTERWAAFLSEKCGSPTKDIDDVKKKKTSYDRYQAVNLANSATIEIRIFRGSLKPETVKATLWLVDAVSRFVLADKDVMKCSFKELIDYDNAPAFVREYLEARKVWVD